MLAAIMAVRPDSEARLLSVEKFEKERMEKQEEDVVEGYVEERGEGERLLLLFSY